MTAIVSVETVLLVLLVVLVIGLLRSHAEILRRLGPPLADGEPDAGLNGLPEPPARRRTDTAAPAIAGPTPSGDALALDFTGPAAAPTLLAFLTSGCSTCAGFWTALSEQSSLPPELRTVIITHGTDRESPSRLRKLAPAKLPVIMSSAAWQDYRVPGAPYFVLVDGEIKGEGVATTWDALSSLVRDAIEDQRGDGAQARGSHIDDVFAAAGISTSHPSLYPGGRSQ